MSEQRASFVITAKRSQNSDELIVNIECRISAFYCLRFASDYPYSLIRDLQKHFGILPVLEEAIK